MEKRFYFIVNPVAGRRGARLPVVREIEHFCRSHGIDYDLVVTKRPGEAIDLARDAAGSYPLVVAVGGDGTINEVATGVLGTEAVLGILPTGSGNDLSPVLGLRHSIAADLRVLLEGRVWPIDVGRVNGQFYFFNAASVGFDAAVAAGMRRYGKMLPGFLAYVTSAVVNLATYQFRRVKLTIDNEYTIEREALFVAVCNGTTYGGGFRVAPEAKLDDRIFSVYLIERTTRWYALRNMPKFIRGHHQPLEPVHLYTGSSILIESPDAMPAQVDGELLVPRPSFHIELMPERLRVMAAR